VPILIGGENIVSAFIGCYDASKYGTSQCDSDDLIGPEAALVEKKVFLRSCYLVLLGLIVLLTHQIKQIYFYYPD
jgi:hypothetical protein